MADYTQLKLYPPYIEGTIPAFYKDDEGTATLAVPFSMNKAVSKSEVTGFHLKMKTVQSGAYLMTLDALTNSEYDLDKEYCAYFKLTADQVNILNIGQSYKIQLAYDNNGGVGYYSTISVVKFTTKPKVTIDNLTVNSINMNQYSYTGHYAQIDYEYKEVKLSSDLYKTNTYYIRKNNAYQLDSNDFAGNQTYYMRVPQLDIDNDNYKDSSEKVYSYRFTIYKNKELVLDSGWLLHNSSEDINSYESSDSYQFQTDLNENISYYLQYSVTTVNGLQVDSPKYRIMQKQTIAPELNATIVTELDRENGYIKISLAGILDEDGDETAATGSFIIARSSSTDNYTIWNELNRFTLHGEHPSRKVWKDFTIEQGKGYKYSIQQYSDSGLYSSRIISNVIRAEFEDAFLYDGTRQLKIKYNPKISSFKTDYLETKTETIGSKYPFIFRNGNVEYKEFSLSGLISYQSDDEHLFITNKELELDDSTIPDRRSATLKKDLYTKGIDEFLNNLYLSQGVTNEYSAISNNYYDVKDYIEERNSTDEQLTNGRLGSSDLEDLNILAERKFKLEVLDWLNNGEAKLFRSPTEGNYLVRLMNVSFAPEDALGRMLHTFTATAYEIADCTYENMNNLNIIDIGTTTIIEQLRWESVPMVLQEDEWAEDEDERYTKAITGSTAYFASGNILGTRTAITVRFTDFLPGSIVHFTQEGDTEQDIVIGATGAYLLDNGLEITSVKVDPLEYQYQGMITYSYKDLAQNIFNEIETIDIIDVPAKQAVGTGENIVTNLNNIRDTLIDFLYLHFTYRPVRTTSIDITSDTNWKTTLATNCIDPFALYKFTTKRWIYNNSTIYFSTPLIMYYDMLNPNAIILDETSVTNFTTKLPKVNYIVYGTNITLGYGTDSETFSIDEIKTFCVDTPLVFDIITMDPGVVLEYGYQYQQIHYSLEYNNLTVAKALAEYTARLNKLAPSIDTLNAASDTELQSIASNMEAMRSKDSTGCAAAYTEFLAALETAKEEWEAGL